jgi:hypothetical protein
METVIETMIDRAAEANDWTQILRYQWVIASAETVQTADATMGTALLRAHYLGK